nr:unnamed protein product [Callosobruchus analis]
MYEANDVAPKFAMVKQKSLLSQVAAGSSAPRAVAKRTSTEENSGSDISNYTLCLFEACADGGSREITEDSDCDLYMAMKLKRYRQQRRFKVRRINRARQEEEGFQYYLKMKP